MSAPGRRKERYMKKIIYTRAYQMVKFTGGVEPEEACREVCTDLAHYIGETVEKCVEECVKKVEEMMPKCKARWILEHHTSPKHRQHS